MARSATDTSKQESNGNGTNQPYQKLKWANIYLDAQQKEAAKLFLAKEGELDNLFATILCSGYSVGFSFNEQTDSTICTLICKNEDDPNHGWATTSHARDWYTALARAFYKHFILGDGITYEELAERYASPLT